MTIVAKTKQTIGSYTGSITRDDADNGATLPLDILVLIDLTNADVLQELPALAGLPVGSTVHVKTLGGFTVNRAIISVEGTEAEQLLGQGIFADEGTIALSGYSDYYTFKYMGDAFGGAEIWEVTNHDKDLADADKWAVRAATRVALPAFAVAGALHTQTLTGSINGALVVDGIDFEGAPSTEPVGGVLLGSETGANRQYHGLWHVINGGSAGTKWVLRRRVDFLYSSAAKVGGNVFVELGATNSGKIFAIPAGTVPGSQFEWTPIRAVGSGDFSDDQTANTSGAVTAVLLTIPKQAADTVMQFKVSVIAQDEGAGGEMQGYEHVVRCRWDDSADLTISQVDLRTSFEDQAPLSDAVTFVDNADAVDITVLGIGGQDISWRGQYEALFLTLGGG